jgi:hypothetical protein
MILTNPIAQKTVNHDPSTGRHQNDFVLNSNRSSSRDGHPRWVNELLAAGRAIDDFRIAISP